MSPYPPIGRLIVKSFVGVVVLFAASFAQVSSGIAASVPPAGIHRELYLGLDPTVFGLGALTQHPPFLASHPSTVRILTVFETELNLTNHYGQRLRAYLLPPVTGDYTFWLASDDLSELYLSRNEDPEQKQRIAFVDPRSQPRVWTTHLGQESVPIRLEAGARCYVEVLHVEQNLIDHLALRWRLPNGVVEEPIPASRCVHDLPPLPDALPPEVSVQEGQSFELKAHVRNFQPPSYRWQRDGVDLPGQTNAVLRLPRVSLGDHGHRYQAVLSNSIGSIVTSSVLLSVSPDTTPPALVEVSNVASNLVLLRFSAMLDGEKARQPDHYRVGGVPPQRVDVFEEGRVILLHTPVLNLGLPVQVRVEGLVKSVASPVPMPPTERSFVSFVFQPTALGSSDTGNSGSHETRGSLTRITSLGSANDTREDGGHYAWQWVTGDFDIQAQVQSLEGGDAWGRVGLMVREDLTAESRMAVVWVGSSQLGCLFQHRKLPRGFAISEGRSLPGNPPELWLRLQRTGNRVAAFASSDGRKWTMMGNTDLSLPEWFYLGPCLAGSKSNTLTTASVEISSPIVGPIAPPGLQPPSSEPPGPSSRKTSCVFTEIMYHPAGVSTDGAETMEFIELYNAGPFAEDLTGYRISGDATFMFPPGVTLLPGAYLVIARSPQAFRETHPECDVLGPFQRHLPNDSGRVRLRDKQGGVLLEVDYESEFPWPTAPDGAGASLTLTHPSYGEGSWRAWSSSEVVGGSPGRPGGSRVDPLGSVTINEWRTHSPLGEADFVELFNCGPESVDLSGARLTDVVGENGFRFPAGTVLPPGGFHVVYEEQLGFALRSSGEHLVLFNPSRSRVIDSVKYGPQGLGISSGRFPDGQAEIQHLTHATPGFQNAPPTPAPVVINELMFHPLSGDDNEEYIELFNPGAHAVDLSGWKFTKGITFTFPLGTTLAPGGYVVVAKDRTRLRAKYPHLNSTTLLGDYGGVLGDDGDRVALVRPVAIVVEVGGISMNQLADAVVEEFEYQTGGAWGTWADRGGSSLERVDVRADARRPSSWADSDESEKAPWTLVEFTGVLDHAARSSDPADALDLVLLGEGECLVDDVEARVGAGANLVRNPDFATSFAFWSPQGNHVRSARSTDPTDPGSTVLHLRASSQGDTGANRIRSNLGSVINKGDTATLRARVRWLKGWPEVVLRLRGNGLEAYGRLDVPSQPGSPGLRNSRAVLNAGPSLDQVSHWPVLPRADEPIQVSVRVGDPDGIDAVGLRYRVDPSQVLLEVPLRDDGQGPDRFAGDGRFSGQIPGQARNAMVAFWIEATDAAASPGVSRFPPNTQDNRPRRECLIRVDDPTPATTLGSYRFWLTEDTIDTWTRREVLSNEPLPGTFVYGNHRVVYQAAGRYAGSPFHQDQAGPHISPVGSSYHFALELPTDDRVLGADSFNKIHCPGNNTCDDATLQLEFTAYEFARWVGLPWCPKRFVHMFVNGQRRGLLMEDTLIPSKPYLDRFFPEDRLGDLYKLSMWLEYDAAGVVLGARTMGGADLNLYTSKDGSRKTARYRWTWQPRATRGTANNFDPVFRLIDAATSAPDSGYVALMEEQVDVEQWMRTFALEHALGNWDSFGFKNQQNMYAFKPEAGRWKLLIWDLNLVMGGGTRGTPIGPVGDDLMDHLVGDVGLHRIYEQPAFQRAFWQAIQDLAHGPFDGEPLRARVLERYRALSAEGLRIHQPEAMLTWLARRRAYLLERLARVDAQAFEVNLSAGSISSDTPRVQISGTAPLSARTLAINGVTWPLQWLTVTQWTVIVEVNQATNHFTLEARDRSGNALAGASHRITVLYTGSDPGDRLRLKINEWMAVNTSTTGFADPADGDFDDWFELFNPGDTELDLTGYELSDDPRSADRFRIPAGYRIAPKGFLLVWADGEPWQNQADSGELHVNFQLAGAGEDLLVFDPAGGLLDHVRFGSQLRNVSEGRKPDGAELVITQTMSSPGSSNSGEVRVGISISPISSDRVIVHWSTTPGRSYQLEEAIDLEEGAWVPFGPVQQGIRGSLSQTIGVTPETFRFYRVRATTP